MKLMSFGVLGLSFLFYFPALPAKADDTTWEKIDQIDDVVIYSKAVLGSDVRAYRGVGNIPAPIAKVASIVLDVPRRVEWCERLRESVILSELSPFESIQYAYVEVPSRLVSNRDFVFTQKVEADKVAKTITIRISSILDSRKPEGSDPVRGKVSNGILVMSSAEDGTKTHIDIEGHIDPHGNVPAFLVNSLQQRMPRSTLLGLMSQLSKVDVIESPLVRSLLAD